MQGLCGDAVAVEVGLVSDVLDVVCDVFGVPLAWAELVGLGGGHGSSCGSDIWWIDLTAVQVLGDGRYVDDEVDGVDDRVDAVEPHR